MSEKTMTAPKCVKCGRERGEPWTAGSCGGFGCVFPDSTVAVPLWVSGDAEDFLATAPPKCTGLIPDAHVHPYGSVSDVCDSCSAALDEKGE